ncbi:retrovirus-related Pol polyprotein from transposon RE1 [Quercus suber]|uniref:retrovirus-related Pol polyprotein from transposon RE1 n=1 Tax=Quercus suber TaxID=58331 RepID=UPI0032DFD0C8
MASDSTTTQSQTTHLVHASSAMIADEYVNNPFFLPANENPGLMLTSQPLTGPWNYMSWVRSVFLALISRNKFGFVDGSIAEPDSSSSLYNSWSRSNTTVLSWLTNSLSLDLKASVMYINNARDLWIDLKDRLSQGNTLRLFELGKEIAHLAQGSLSVSSYFTKFKTLWDDSKSAQLDAHYKEHVFMFLMGLNDGYGHVISQILMIEPLPSLSKVCSLILQEEKRRNIGQSFNMIQSSDSAAMYVNNSRGLLGYQGQKNGGKGGNGKKDRPVCTNCGFTGHIADKCYKLHGYPQVTSQKER